MSTTPGTLFGSTGAAAQTAAQTMVPLRLSGNMTDQQQARLKAMVHQAAEDAYATIRELLDQQSAQTILDGERKLGPEITRFLVDSIQQHTISDKYKEEEVGSNRKYPNSYRERPVEAQVTELRKAFPELGHCNEKLARRPLPTGAEAWFAIPRWDRIAPTYHEAVLRMVEAMAARRRFSNRIAGKMTEQFLRSTERSQHAFQLLCEQQEGSDILVIGAQFGLLHRGSSARRTRVVLASNEYCLGSFAIGAMLLTHPERLSSSETLMIDCGGDEYSLRGDNTFDRVPLFDYDLGGVEFSIFYEDRARNLWGTPTAFLYKMV